MDSECLRQYEDTLDLIADNLVILMRDGTNLTLEERDHVRLGMLHLRACRKSLNTRRMKGLK